MNNSLAAFLHMPSLALTQGGGVQPGVQMFAPVRPVLPALLPVVTRSSNSKVATPVDEWNATKTLKNMSVATIYSKPRTIPNL